MKYRVLKIFTLILVFTVFLSVFPTQHLLASGMQTEETAASIQPKEVDSSIEARDAEHLQDLLRRLNGSQLEANSKLHEVSFEGTDTTALKKHLEQEVKEWHTAWHPGEEISPVSFQFTPIKGESFEITNSCDLIPIFDTGIISENAIEEKFPAVYFTVTVGTVSEETHYPFKITWTKAESGGENPVESGQPEEPKDPESPADPLQTYLDRTFCLENISYWQTNQKLDQAEIDWHIVLPQLTNKEYVEEHNLLIGDETFEGLGLDNYRVKYTSSADTIDIQWGYQGKVVRPLPGESTTNVTLTATLKNEKDPTQNYSKSLDFVVMPLSEQELSQAIRLMEASKAAFADALLGKNEDPQAVHSNLQTFFEMRFSANDELEIIRDVKQRNYCDSVNMDKAGNNSDIQSSCNDIITDFSLEVWPPEYNTEVTLSSKLTYYPFNLIGSGLQNGTIKPVSDEGKAAAATILEKLYQVPVTATYKVTGTTDKDDPNTPKRAQLLVEGSKILMKPEDKGKDNQESWFDSGMVEFEPGTKLVDFVNQTLRSCPDMEDLVLDMKSGWLTSITFKNHPANITGVTNGSLSSWMWYRKDKDSGEFSLKDVDPALNMMQDGDVIKLKFINDPGYPYSIQDESLDPDNAVQLTDETDWWTGYRGDEQNNSPNKISENLEQATQQKVWSYITDEKNDWGGAANLSDMLIIQDKIYVAVKDRLIVLSTDGEKINETKLKGSIGYISRPAYRGGLILIPLEGGAVQAVRPDSLETVWVSGSIDAITLYQEDAQGDMVAKSYPLQNQGTTYIKNNIAYIPLSAVENFKSVGGVLRAIDLTTGCEKWRFVNNSAGFYWAGATQIGDYILIGDDSGQVIALKTDGSNIYQPIIFNENKSPIRSTMVQYGGKLYFTTTDGMLHELNFDATNGEFGAHRSVAFAKNSASTPTIYHGMIYVGGSDGTWNQNSGIFAVIDLATFKLQKTYQVAGGVLSAPLVVENKDGKFYVYFTANTDQGFLYVYNAAEQKVEKAFVPGSAEAQYTTANPIVGPDGRIYYTTDAGAIVALQGGDLIEEYDLTIDRSQLPAAVKDVEISMLEPLHLLRHSTFSIVDRTDNMSMLYADEIKANIGDTKYIAFQTNFTGDVEGNPQIRLNITVDSTKFPLEKDQQFSLYKLQGKKFVPVTFRDTQAAIGMKNDGVSLMLAPRVFAAVMNGMMQTKGDQTIHFEQGLKDNATYLLAATPKKAEQPSGDKTESQPSETKGQTKPENSQQTEKTPEIVKTGEAVEYTAYIFVLGALIMLTARFSFRKSRKRK